MDASIGESSWNRKRNLFSQRCENRAAPAVHRATLFCHPGIAFGRLRRRDRRAKRNNRVPKGELPGSHDTTDPQQLPEPAHGCRPLPAIGQGAAAV